MTPEVLDCFKLYVEHRKEGKTALTKTAARMALKKVWELSGGSPRMAIAIITQTLENNWLGIFQLSVQNLERFRKNEQERIAFRVSLCLYCNKPITESQRWAHEDSECPNFRKMDKAQLTEIVESLSDKWKAN
jgi:hypothetical protein